MKKFKKGVLAIGVLAAAAVIAAGCGKKDAKTTNETKVLKMQAENKVLLSSGESYIDMSKDLIEMGAKQVLIN